MMTNMVDESGITNTKGKGVRDVRLIGRAEEITGQQEDLQKDLLSISERREHHYSREKLLPEKVLDILPYKLTYEALL